MNTENTRQQIPYITIQDLNTVLDDMTADCTISKKTAARLLHSSVEFTQRLIRKSDAAKALSARRQKCIDTLSLIVATVKSRIGERRLQAELQYKEITDRRRRLHDIDIRRAKNECRLKENDLKNRLGLLHIQYLSTADESARIKITAEEQQLQDRRRTLALHMQEVLLEIRTAHAEATDRDSAAYRAACAHRDFELSEINVQRMNMYRSITAAPDLAAISKIEDELEHWLGAVRLAEEAASREGGAA